MTTPNNRHEDDAHNVTQLLLLSEQRLQLALDAAHAGTWEWLLADNSNYWSESLWPLYGLERGQCETTYDSWLTTVVPEDLERITATINTAVAAGAEFELQWRVKLPEGEPERWLFARGRPVLDTTGKPERYLGIVIDITGTKRSTAERQLWADAFHHCRHGIGLGDPATNRLIACNPAYATIFGSKPQELQGRLIAELYPAEARDKIMNCIAHADAEGMARHETDIQRQDGTFITVQVDVVSIRGDNERLAYRVATVQDITERKQAETAVEERLSIEQEILKHQQLLRDMAQDLAMAEDRERDRIAVELHDQVTQRLVLAKMKVEALERKLASPTLETATAGISELLSQIIDDTRSLTAQIRPPILAGGGLEAALKWLGEELQEQYGLTVELCDDHQPKNLEYDLRSMVFQSVRELLVNVAKHAGTRNARIELSREGTYLKIIVSDDGIGFDPVAAQIRKARIGGFGLFSLRQKIEYLGGQLEVDSQPGAGTRITMRIPLPVLETAEATSGKLKVLLVDDQSFIREGLQMLVELEPDMEVVAEAENGLTAIAMARELNPDVVVMDLSMPNMNGIDATRAITTEMPGVRVVVFSVEADRRFVIDALKAGASGYVLKDSAFNVLATAIRTVATGETYLGPRISEIIIREYLQRVPDVESLCDEPLTVREREVLQLVTDGKSGKEIAFMLEISIKTVDSLRHNIMNKLDLYSTAELTKYAIREGLTSLK